MGKLAKLSALTVQRLTRRGRYADGGGLYLQISKYGTKTWIFRFMLNGRAREMGLGPLELVSLAEARELRIACRKLLQAGRDPIEDRKCERRSRALEAMKMMTFRECALAYIDSHSKEWKNDKHLSQWKNTLESYVFPTIGDLAVQSIDSDLVMRVLEPIWTAKTETAVRVRGRIEVVLDWASARKLRQGDNPARWRGHLDKLLPRPSRISPHRHHAALAPDKVSALLVDIRQLDTVGALALEFLILTAARTGEVLGARWSEIDFTEKTWTIPAERMKAGSEHRVPLSQRAMEILLGMRRVAASDFVFPGRRPGTQLSNMALLEILRRRGSTVVTHGFRSTFKDWASEYTNFPNEVTEMALAHKVKNKVEAAYRRGDLFLKRRKLMEAWAQFCCQSRSKSDGIVKSLHQSA